MTGILDLLNSDLGKSIISEVADSTGNDSNFLEQILDADGDGSVVDDVAGMLLGGGKKQSGGIGGLLGGFFGK